MAEHNFLRDKWYKQHPLTIFTQGDFYRYDARSGLWRIKSEILIRQEIIKIIEDTKGARSASSTLNSVLVLAKATYAIDDRLFDNKPNLLCCRNGTLEIDTRTLRPHKPDDYLTSGVGFDYDPKAEAPAWTKYLEYLTAATSPEVVNFLQEFAGLCATTETKYEIALWLYGPPGCGKSTFIEGLLAAFKDRSCILGLADIGRNQFALTNLPGKTLALATEQPSRSMQSTYILNSIISGEPVKAERKYHDPQEINPVCKILWAMNKLPDVDESTNGIFRRTAVLELPELPLKDRNPQLKQAIKREGAGILNWALIGLERVILQNQIVIPKEIQSATAAFQQANDLAALFLKETKGMSAIGRFEYKDYEKWCKDNGYKAKPANKISKDWERLGYENKRVNGETYWVPCK